MSQIIHRCKSCGHPDFWALSGTAAAGRNVDGSTVANRDARTCCRGAGWNDPEVIPTYDRDGHEMTNLIEPGGPAGPANTKTCCCDDCRALFAGLTVGQPVT